MSLHFRDRYEAGELLADKLARFSNREEVLIMALPRGGVPVAAVVARKLNLPLDVFVVRKLGLPGHPELAMGAIASGGVRILNREVVESLNISEAVINAVADQEQHELERREKEYRDDLPRPDLYNKIVILIDDGVATGSTMVAAIAALRQLDAGRIVVATPTVAASTYEELAKLADEVEAVITPGEFYGVGQWYEDFSQTSDEEVSRSLERFRRTAG